MTNRNEHMKQHFQGLRHARVLVLEVRDRVRADPNSYTPDEALMAVLEALGTAMQQIKNG